MDFLYGFLAGAVVVVVGLAIVLFWEPITKIYRGTM